MKKLLFILFLLAGYLAGAQQITYTPMTAAGYQFKYGKFDSLIHVPFGDTAIKRGTTRPGALMCFTGDSTIYRWDGLRWHQLAGVITQPDGIVSGGIVSWDSLLVFSITSAVYWINGVQYTSVAQSLTLDPADPTNPRIDVFALDTSGTFVAVPGTPSTPPVEPGIDPATQLYRAFTQIAAGATVPAGVTQEIIYDENIEWTATTGTGLTVNYDDVSTPFHLVKDANVGTWATTRTITFTHGSVLNRNDYTLLKMYINLKAALPSTANIQIYFLNGTTQITPTTNLGAAHGFSKTGVGYQNVTVQLSTLAFSGSDFTKVVIRFTGVGSGIYLDWAQLQGGVVNGSTNFITDVYRISGTTNVMKVINGVSTLAFTDSVGTGGGGISTAVDTIWRTPGQDSIKFSINGRLRSVIDSVGSGGGVSTAVDSIWRTEGEDSIKFSIAGRLRSIKDSAAGIPFTSDGIDSITFYGNTLCQWSAGTPTCYQLDRFYENVVFNHDTTMYIASSGGIVIDSFPIFYNKIFAGTNMVIRDSTLPSGETGYILDASGGGGGGSGTVTSISQGFGITNTPNPITTTGTIAADTSVAGLSGYYVRLGEGYWETIGNTVLDTLVNFLGTPTGVVEPIILRVNGVRAGAITDSLVRNTSLGWGAMRNGLLKITPAQSFGSLNSAFGFKALYGVTSGHDNTAMGPSSMVALTTGAGNVGIGPYTLQTITTQSQNTAIGNGAMSLSTGANSVAVGQDALRSSTASDNTAVGFEALYTNTSAAGNVAVGYRAGLALNASNNTAVGGLALTATTSGYQNTAVGYATMDGNVSGVENTAIGYTAGRQGGSFNTSIGNRVRNTTSTGNYNTALGYSANISGGAGATGLYLGAFAGSANTASNKLFINASQAAATNHLIHGDFSTKQVQINSVTTPVLKASAALEVISTTMGFLPPVMTATQASAISSPAEGLLVYVTDTNGTFASKGWWGYNGAAWEKLNN